jgi:hypothetical protein
MTDGYMIRVLAPNMQAFPHSDYDTALNGDPNQPPVAPMTGLQITMSREIGGWPLYTIVIAFGQVSDFLHNEGTSYYVHVRCSAPQASKLLF